MAKKGAASRAAIWVILGLLFIGLVGFGVGDFGGSVRTVGTVNDKEIELQQYANQLQRELQGLSQQIGRPLTLQEGRVFGVDAQVLSRMVSETLLVSETDRLGLSVGDVAVRDQITALQGFQGLDGQFDREAYEFSLRQSGLTIAEFEQQIRDQTAMNILQGAIVGATAAPQSFVDILYTYARETRDITWARLTEEQLAEEIAEPSEEDLIAYHSDNPDPFTLGETRAITYAWLTPDMLLDTIESDETLLREFYEARINQFVQPERRLVERLVFRDDAAATDAKTRIDAGEVTFDQLVEERGLVLADVEIGAVAQADLDDAGDGVFALEGPGVAGPLPSNLGPALYRVNAILAANETTFEEAREGLEEDFARDRSRRVIEDMLEDLDDLLAGGATIEDMAAETEMELGQIDWRQAITDGIAAYDSFRAAALTTTVDDFPELLQLNDGGVFVLRVDEILEPALQDFEIVREDVEAAWRVQETEIQLDAIAQDTAQAIRDGAEMASFDLPLATDRAILRDAFLEGTPEGFVAGVFEMKEGDIRIFRDEGAVVLARLDAVTPPSPDDSEAQGLKSTFSAQMEQQIAGDLLQAFTQQLQSTADIQINQQAIEALFAQYQN